jgi:hypothetical protein
MMGVKGIREKNVYFYYIILRLTGMTYINSYFALKKKKF